MATIFLASPVLSDAATISVSGSASTSLNEDNLQTLDPRQYWRSSTSTPNIVIDLGSAQSIRYVSLLYGNFVSTDTWRVRAATTEAGLTSAPGYDSGSVSCYPGGADLSSWDRTHTRLYLTTAQSYRWWRIDIDASSNPDGYVETARLYVSEGIQPEIGISHSALWTPILVEAGVRTVNQSGGITPRGFPKRRNVEVTFSYLTRDEAFGGFGEVRRERGSSGDVVVLIDPEEDTYPMDYTYYGLMSADQPIPNTYLAGGEDPRFAVTLNIEEP